MENLLAFVPSLVIGADLVIAARVKAAREAYEGELMARAWGSGFRAGTHATAVNAARQAHETAHRIVNLALGGHDGEG